MSDFDLTRTLRAAIADECPAAPGHRLFVELAMSTIRLDAVTIYCASPDAFRKQSSPGLVVSHLDGNEGPWASILVTARAGEDPVALCERALAFVREEASVSC
ncbi:hypothetical protein [Gordonia sp. (in: high G+C Gram-positive bacteria)]|uniref:hypothetical protein n=1 Tax=Gordonia sp. (in: high G+C Gram-positive bacteria) TaxID=84139 RepID=UPI003340FD41